MRKHIALMAFLLTGVLAFAAGPMPDKFSIHFTNPTFISTDLTLQPGSYRFQRIVRPTEPASFTIYDATGNAVGQSSLAPAMPRTGTESATDVTSEGYAVIDTVDGKDYLDSVFLQGMNHGMMFNIPSEIRDQAKQNNQQKKVNIQTGGQE